MSTERANPWAWLLELREPERRVDALALVALLLGLSAALVAGEGPWSTWLALFTPSAALFVAVRLGPPASLYILLFAALGSWGAFAGFTSGPAGIVRDLAYFAAPPLLVHLVLTGRAQERLRVGLLPIYAPMLVAQAGVLLRTAAPFTGGGLEWAYTQAATVAAIYGICYVVLLLVILATRLSAPRVVAPVRAPSGAELEEQGRFGLAARAYERSNELEKGAEMAQRAGDWLRAADLFRRSDDWFRAAEMYSRAERWNEAVEAYERAKALVPAALLCEQLAWFERAAELYERAGDPASALRTLQAAGVTPKPEQLLRVGQFAAAAQGFERDGRWQRAAEVLEQQAGDPEGALRLYLEHGAWLQAGQLLEQAGRPEDALQAYLASPATALEAARLCLRLGRHEQAAQVLSKLPQAELERLDDEATLVLVARVFSESGRVDEAARTLQGLKRRGGMGGEAYLLLGRCLMDKRLFDLAEEELRVAASLPLEGASEQQAQYLLGRVLEELGRGAEALQAYQGVLQKDLGYADVEERYRRLRASPPAA